ncbi:MAG: hypothetical protein ACP5J4_20670 [Anaerolineae bacterium]
MPRKKAISDEVRADVEARVARFNRDVVKNPHQFFSVRFRGKNAYLDRDDYGHVGPRARLTYTGDMEQWKFAIYKYSDECYDPEEWMFPGAGHVDGTVEGALRAAMEAYP